MVTSYDDPATPAELSAHFKQLREKRGNDAYIIFLERYVELVLEKNPKLTAHIGERYVRISDAERRASPAYANHTGKIDIDVPPREALKLSPFVGVKDPARYSQNNHQVFVSVREHPSKEAVDVAAELTRRAMRGWH